MVYTPTCTHTCTHTYTHALMRNWMPTIKHNRFLNTKSSYLTSRQQPSPSLRGRTICRSTQNGQILVLFLVCGKQCDHRIPLTHFALNKKRKFCKMNYELFVIPENTKFFVCDLEIPSARCLINLFCEFNLAIHLKKRKIHRIFYV